jgi:hypothetical protein
MKHLKLFEQFVHENINEGRIALNHVYANAPVRNKVLEILKNGRVTEQDFMDAVSKAGAPSKWISRNSHFFKVEEEDGVKYYSLSKNGQTIISALNEAVDVEYWADYNDDTSGQSPKNFSEKMKNLEAAFKMAVSDWQKEDSMSSSEISSIHKMAEEFFKKAGWISPNVVQAMIAQSLNESASAEDILEVYEEFGLEENLIIDPLDLTKDIFYVSINGKTYGYQAKPGGNIEDAATTFKKMLKYSAGRALAWLKKNTELALGAGGSGPLREGFNPSDVSKAVSLISKEIGNDPGYFFLGDEDAIKVFNDAWKAKKYQQAMDILAGDHGYQHREWTVKNFKDVEEFIKDNG